MTCGGWRRCIGPSAFSFDCSEMITGRNEQALLFCLDVRTSTQAIQSIVTRAFGREEEPNPEIDSSPKHRMSFKARSFTWSLPVTGIQKPRKAAKRESVLPRERVVGQGHEHALFGQGHAAVRWLQKRAQLSRLVVLGRVQRE